MGTMQPSIGQFVILCKMMFAGWMQLYGQCQSFASQKIKLPPIKQLTHSMGTFDCLLTPRMHGEYTVDLL